MVYDKVTAVRVRERLERHRGITEKRMFGGVGFLLNGNMCIAVWKEFLILRLGAEHFEAALEEPATREFDITGRAMTGWIMVEPEGFDGDEELAGWLERAIHFVRTLPPK